MDFAWWLPVIYLVHSTLVYVMVSARCKRKESCFETLVVGGNNEQRPLGRQADGETADPVDLNVKVKHGKRCCPYDFDSRKCRILDDRVLCGFDKNIGWPTPKDVEKELAEGCRLRGGRMECGYAYPPHQGIRRPPAWDNVANVEHNTDNPIEDSDEHQPHGDDDGHIIHEHDSEKLVKGVSRATTKAGVRRKRTTTAGRDCVEINDRIVCKPARRQFLRL